MSVREGILYAGTVYRLADVRGDKRGLYALVREGDEWGHASHWLVYRPHGDRWVDESDLPNAVRAEIEDALEPYVERVRELAGRPSARAL